MCDGKTSGRSHDTSTFQPQPEPIDSLREV